MNGNIQTRDLYGPKSSGTVKSGPVVMVVLAATMIGASSGVLIADRDAFLLLTKNLESQLAGVRRYLLATPDTASVKPETPNVIPTGLSSIASIQYSTKQDSTSMAFDLQSANLVRAGKLRNPDRIYFDLQERNRDQGTSTRQKMQKTFALTGNLLSGVRISQRKQGSTRIVLDLRCSCDFTHQVSPGPPSRLMVEVRPRPAGGSASNTQRSAS